MEISDIYQALRKFWWLVLSVTLILAIATFTKVASDKYTYSSTIDLKTTQAQIQVVNINNKQDTTQQGKAISTLYADILNSKTFNSEVIELASIKKGPLPFLKIKAEQSPGSNYLTLVVEADNFFQIKRITEATADMLVKRVERDSLGNVSLVRKKAADKIKKIDANLKKLRQKLFKVRSTLLLQNQNKNTNANEVNETEKRARIGQLNDRISDVLSLRQAYTDYLNRIEVSNFSQASAIRKVSEASKPVKVSKQYVRNIGLSVGVGLLISIALAMIIETTNKKKPIPHNPEDRPWKTKT